MFTQTDLLETKVTHLLGHHFNEFFFRRGSISEGYCSPSGDLPPLAVSELEHLEEQFHAVNIVLSPTKNDVDYGWIVVSPEHLHDDPFITHLTLMYACLHVNDLRYFIRDAIVMALEQDLRRKVPRFYSRLKRQLNISRRAKDFEQLIDGGFGEVDHSVLFILKSFALDLDANWPIGTVLHAADFLKTTGSVKPNSNMIQSS